MAIDDAAANVDQARVSAALRSAMERLQTATSGAVTVSAPVLTWTGGDRARPCPARTGRSIYGCAMTPGRSACT